MLARFTPFLPPGWSVERVMRVMGLMSDTHMPDRCDALPPALFDALAGVDLLLHAGDVGELYVLDQLSQIAPVIAVHGNDDSASSKQELPFQQIITIAGTRLCLTHGHYPNRDDDMAARRIDDWAPKLDRWAKQGRQAGASVFIYGHTHIPMLKQHNDVLLINPGAIASGSHMTRQLVQTVALLFVRDDGAVGVSHIDLADLTQPYGPQVEWGDGFKAALNQFQASILTDDLEELMPQLWPIYHQMPAHFIRMWRPVAFRCWHGEVARISRVDILAAVSADTELPPETKAQLRAILG